MKPSKKGRIIAFIAEFTDQHGFSPTYREIAEGLGYASVSTVHKHITELKEKGLISETDGKSRSLVLVNGIDGVDRNNPEEQHVCLKTSDGGSLFLTYVMHEGGLDGVLSPAHGHIIMVISKLRKDCGSPVDKARKINACGRF